MNERAYLTEARDQDWYNLQGVFPEYNGEQSRIWGKRTHFKYPNGVYGIHQFWTPYGYAGGIYQFDGNVDFGVWITPTSKFDFTLPPLPTDTGGFTIDDFGYPQGNDGGYRTGDECVLSFLANGTDHASCNVPTDRFDTPDDTNGSPHGQGRRCGWTESSTVYNITDFMQSKETAAGIGYSNIVNRLEVSGISGGGYTCSVATPAPPILGPDIAFGAYGAVAIGAVGSQQVLEAHLIYTNMLIAVPGYAGPCLFAENYTQSADSAFATNSRCVLNFASLVSAGNAIVRVALLTTGPLGARETDIVIPDFTKNFLLDMQAYRQQGVPVHASTFDTVRSDSATCSQVRVTSRQRLCA